MAEDAGLGMGLLQATEQAQQGAFLAGRAGVGGFAVFVEAPFVADAERVLVVAYGVGAHQLFVARLVGPAVAGDVVVVARESEPFRVTADEGCHGKVLVRPRGRTVNHYQRNTSHFTFSLFHFFTFSPLHAAGGTEGGEHGCQEVNHCLYAELYQFLLHFCHNRCCFLIVK